MVILGWLALGVGLLAPAGNNLLHPIHAARVEVIAKGKAVTATVRVYQEDFPPGTQRDSAAVYLAKNLRLLDRSGGAVALQIVSMTPEGDRLRIELKGICTTGLDGGRVAVTLLNEKFKDQINVVNAKIDGSEGTLVFLVGDSARALP